MIKQIIIAATAVAVSAGALVAFKRKVKSVAEEMMNEAELRAEEALKDVDVESLSEEEIEELIAKYDLDDQDVVREVFARIGNLKLVRFVKGVFKNFIDVSDKLYKSSLFVAMCLVALSSYPGVTVPAQVLRVAKGVIIQYFVFLVIGTLFKVYSNKDLEDEEDATKRDDSEFTAAC